MKAIKLHTEMTSDTTSRLDTLLSAIERDIRFETYNEYTSRIHEYKDIIQSLQSWDGYDYFYAVAPLIESRYWTKQDSEMAHKEKLMELSGKALRLRNSLTENTASDLDVPSKLQRVFEFSTASLTILFAMTLVAISIVGRSIPNDAKGILRFLLSFGVAISWRYFGSQAHARGKLLISPKWDPIAFSITGGGAIFIITYLMLYLTSAP
jgi:hypothetical protein